MSMGKLPIQKCSWIFFGALMVLSFQNCMPSSFVAKAPDLSSTQEELGSVTQHPPILNLLAPVPVLTNNRALTVVFTLTLDPAAKMKSVTCQLDQQKPVSCENLQWNLTNLTDGDHALKIEAEDSLGQKATSLSAVVRVDATAPVLVPTQVPPAITGSLSAQIEFSVQDALSGLSSTECAFDSEVFKVCVSPLSLTNLSVGDHKLRIRAQDKAGNLSTVSEIKWKVDLSAPTLQITAKPNAVSNSLSAGFTFSASVQGASISGYECALDSGGFSACTSPKNYSGLTQGSHSFQVRAKTSTGVTSAALTSSWVIDAEPPTKPVITTSTLALSNAEQVVFSFLASDAASSVQKYQCQLDSAAFADCSSPKSYSAVSDGSHKFGVRAVDAAGNISAVAEFSWVTDRSIDLSFTAFPLAVSNDTATSFAFTVTESGSGVVSLKCQLDSGSNADCTSPKSYSGLSAGSHTFRVTATDRAGNSKTLTYSWAINAPEPVIDGVALYANNCSICHGAIASSTKIGRSASAITSAIATIDLMKRSNLTALTQAQLKAIETALNPNATSGGTATTPIGQCTATAIRGSAKEAVRRLTREELQASLNSVLPDLTFDLKSQFSFYPDTDIVEDVERFDRIYNSTQALKWAELVDTIYDSIVTRKLQAKIGGTCLQQSSVTEACWRSFFTTFGKKVYRRPLLEDEISKMTSVASSQNASDGLYVAIHMLFRSPAFLFHFEKGVSEESARVRLSDYDVANRISFAIVGTPPDATLLGAADRGELKSLAQVESQVRRLLETTLARKKLEKFYSEWLQLSHVQVPNQAYMTFYNVIGGAGGIDDAMRLEIQDYLYYVVLKQKGTFTDLMTSPIAFPRFQGLFYQDNSKPFSAMAYIYGGDKYAGFSPEGATEASPFPAPNNPGLLTRAGFLASNRWETEPIARGVHIQRRILCEELPSPDFSVVNQRLDEVGDLDPLKYPHHQIIQAKTGGTSCIGCHAKINPVGFALESFDMLGKIRSEQRVLDITKFYSDINGIAARFPIPSSIAGVVIGDKTVSVSGPLQLAQTVASSTTAKRCLASFVVRHYDRRKENGGDSCAVNEAVQVLEENKPVLEVFVKTLANEDIFWRRK